MTVTDTPLVALTEAARRAGLTPRQVAYWDKTGIVRPTHPARERPRRGCPARGSDQWRGYTNADVCALRVVARLAAAGFTVTRLRDYNREQRARLLDALEREGFA